MKKTLTLIAVLSIAMSGFGFASAKPSCAGMMEQSASHSKTAKTPDCCKSGACPCSIEERSNDQTMPASVVTYNPDPPVIAQINFSDTFVSDAALFYGFIEISPPQQTPLYQLFSVYRI